MQVLAAAAAVHRGPEIVQHVAMEADPLAGREPDDPDPRALGLRQQRRADAAVGIAWLSRSNSAAISAGHCDLSFFSAALSSMVRAMAFLQAVCVSYIAYFGKRKDWGACHWPGLGQARGRHRRLDERAAERR